MTVRSSPGRRIQPQISRAAERIRPQIPGRGGANTTASRALAAVDPVAPSASKAASSARVRTSAPPWERAKRSRTVAGIRLTVRDRQLLSFAADHRLVLANHVQALLDISENAAQARLRALSRAGYLQTRPLFHQQPSCYLVSARGLAAIGSTLPRPRLDLRTYMHDVGTAWLWLAASRGAFGPLAEIVSERQMRSRDGLPQVPGLALADDVMGRFGVRLWEVGPGGHERLHYPDLLLRTVDGRRIALELELSPKSPRRLDKIMSGYGADRRVDAVIYLVNRPPIGRNLEAAAARVGTSSLVRVQAFDWTPSMQRLAEQLSPDTSRCRPPVRSPATGATR